jgi:hypothetical protein
MSMNSTHADVVTYFPSEAGMPQNEDVCCIVADIFRFSTRARTRSLDGLSGLCNKLRT